MLTENIQNDINTCCARQFDSRNIVPIIADQNDLIDKLVICESCNINTDLHINTFLRNGEVKIAIS